ncbi:MAG: hypothetical protein ACYC9J_00425 [Sulfuricaulis sp.]
MSTEKLEKQIAQHQARLDEINKETANIDRGRERANIERSLVDTRAEVETLTASIKSGRAGEYGTELAAAIREESRLVNALEKLNRETGSRLDKLSTEEKRLRDELTRLNREIAKARLSEAVQAYQGILQAALPYSDAIKKYANEAGVMLSNSVDGFYPLPLKRGFHVCGGIVIELK